MRKHGPYQETVGSPGLPASENIQPWTLIAQEPYTNAHRLEIPMKAIARAPPDAHPSSAHTTFLCRSGRSNAAVFQTNYQPAVVVAAAAASGLEDHALRNLAASRGDRLDEATAACPDVCPGGYPVDYPDADRRGGLGAAAAAAGAGGRPESALRGPGRRPDSRNLPRVCGRFRAR